MSFMEEIAAYTPAQEQEKADQALILQLIATYGDTILTRECRAAHLTSSGFVVNEARDKALMVYHNIYQSWSWTGGHADGDSDLLAVALREAREETGVAAVRPISSAIASLDILPVRAHVKRGAFVSPHLHLSAAYLLSAPENQPLRILPDENSAVRWIPLEEVAALSDEPYMTYVYQKLIRKLRTMP